MANLNEIRQHQRAVEQTRQITNAMYLLSTSRMRKAMLRVDYNLTYMNRLRATIKDILLKSESLQHLYAGREKHGNALFIVISSDKGMCGSYNSSVLNLAMQMLRQFPSAQVGSIGLFGNEYFANHKIEPVVEWFGASQKPSLFYARQIGEGALNMYEQNTVDEVYVVYTHYKNVSIQTPRCIRLLPLNIRDFDDISVEYEYSADVLYSPTPEKVFDRIVPQYVIGMIYDMLNLSSASEHAARMNAMQSATSNADKMLHSLTAEYNATRQLIITNEITEIAASSELLRRSV